MSDDLVTCEDCDGDGICMRCGGSGESLPTPALTSSPQGLGRQILVEVLGVLHDDMCGAKGCICGSADWLRDFDSLTPTLDMGLQVEARRAAHIAGSRAKGGGFHPIYEQIENAIDAYEATLAPIEGGYGPIDAVLRAALGVEAVQRTATNTPDDYATSVSVANYALIQAVRGFIPQPVDRRSHAERAREGRPDA